MSTPRISLPTAARDVYRAIGALDASVAREPRPRELVCIRASGADLRCVGPQTAAEDDRRIVALAAWHESPPIDERERAVLALTEAMARLCFQGVPDDVAAALQPAVAA